MKAKNKRKKKTRRVDTYSPKNILNKPCATCYFMKDEVCTLHDDVPILENSSEGVSHTLFHNCKDWYDGEGSWEQLHYFEDWFTGEVEITEETYDEIFDNILGGTTDASS